MKKILLSMALVVATSTVAMAQNQKDMEIAGRVSNIDTDKMTFVVETVESIPYNFAVVPSTEFEYKGKVFDNATFSDLKDGIWVRVDYFKGQNIHTADEVKIYEEKSAK